ncbi:MAG TPA: biotin--[acetyl-CoA-carboxylase] ligase [Azospirillaceae bacterium]|nr:biotin--[acetyl-CoA-carboxylase] ligase [Azospirillaceae bacterium]
MRPDGTDNAARTAAATPRPFATLPDWYRLTELERCGSTNDVAKELARSGAPEGTLVRTLMQEAGRGRRGRAWTSIPGNLYCSLVLRPHGGPARAAEISFVAALAVAQAVSDLVPGAPKVKWPNDVLLDGAKIAGILLESEPGPGGTVEWLVLGVGVNVSGHPEGLDYPATSLREAGADIDAGEVLALYGRHFLTWYERWQTYGFAPVRAAWLNAAQGLGGPVTVRLAAESFEGRLVDLDEEGGLIVETGTGRRRVTAGDVFPATSRVGA